MLNARFHEQEAYIVAEAGVPGAITIATNMAGRGTDIKLGGNLEMRIAQELKDVPPGPERDEKVATIKAEIEANREVVLHSGEKADPAAGRKHDLPGGLYIVGTERHESRRIDNQLRGRSGRQGDPGRSKFYLSLQDDLMRIFGSDRMDGMLQKLGLQEDEAIIHPWINKAIEKAQQKVEARNFDIRKNILKYDNVMNDQRKVVFEQRRDFMAQESVRETIDEMRHGVIDDVVTRHIPPDAYPEQWDVEGLKEAVANFLNLELPVADWAKEEGIADEEMRERLRKAADESYAERVEKNSPEVMNYVEKQVLLQIARPSLARAPRHPRPSAPGDRLARLRPARSAERVQVGGLRALQRARRAPAPERHRAAHADRGGVPAARAGGAAADVRPAPRSGDRRERARLRAGQRQLRRRRPGARLCGGGDGRRHGGARARSERSGELGQGRPQRGLPVRLRQEVQALPRPVRVTGHTPCPDEVYV